MGHVGKESGLLSSGVLGTCRFQAKLLLCLHEVGDIARQSEVFGKMSFFIEYGDTRDGIPRRHAVEWCTVERQYGVVGLSLLHGVLYLLHGLLACLGIDCLQIPLYRFAELCLSSGARHVDNVFCWDVIPDVHLVLLQKVAELLFVSLDGLVDVFQLLVVLTLLHIQIALGGDVAVGDDVIHQAVVVNDGTNAELYVLVQSQLRIVQVLANVYDLA